MKLRVLDVQWHIGHAYEMLKFPFVDWSWLLQYKREPFSLSARGDLTKLIRYVPYYESGQYDAAILHLDQDCLDPFSLKYGKGAVYADMNAVITDIPKIVIMHGTPYRPEAPAPYNDPRWMSNQLRELVGDNILIVNSRQAAQQWGIGLPIIHGLDASEWFDLHKYPRVVTTLSKAGMNSYYDRPFLRDVRKCLQERGIELCQIGNDYIASSWTDYRTFLGSSLVYFNPTKESPMPRARTEAMLSGCCVVTTPHHDAADFINQGVNGFLVDRDPMYTADLIENLLNNPKTAIEIGQRGKDQALSAFAWSRFQSSWQSVFAKIVPAFHPIAIEAHVDCKGLCNDQ